MNNSGNSWMNATLTEQGFPGAAPPPISILPPNSGAWAAPVYQTFAGITNLAWRGWQSQFDEATRSDWESALAMWRDPVIYRALRIRQIPTIQLDWTLEPQDETDQVQVQNADKLKKCIERIPDLIDMKRALMEALFYGRYGVQYKAAIDYLPDGTKITFMNGWLPVNGDKIRYKWDGTPGIMVSPAVFSGEWLPTDRGACHFLTPEEQQLFLSHHFERTDVDYFQNQLGGQVEGRGFRDILYWWWWLRNNFQRLLADFMQMVAQGVNIVWYDISNTESLAKMQTIWNNQPGGNVLFLPRDGQKETPYGLERYDPSMAGADLYLKVIEMLNEQMEGAILYETLTHTADPTGIGAGAADAHQTTAEVRTKYDALNLDCTMQKLVNTLNRWNCPGNPAPQHRSAVDKPDPGQWMEAASWAIQNGVTMSTKYAREVLGIPAPDPGEEIIGGIQNLQPAALNTVPQNVPITGQPGPGQVGPMQPQNGQQQQAVQAQPVQPPAGNPSMNGTAQPVLQ